MTMLVHVDMEHENWHHLLPHDLQSYLSGGTPGLMGGFLFLPILCFVLWLEDAPARVMWEFSAVWLIAYFTIRIFANIIMDRDAETARYWNTRKHFSRPSFRMWSDKDGLHVESGPNPDHATRCQNSLREWYEIERIIKWNNWIYGGIILVLVLALKKL